MFNLDDRRFLRWSRQRGVIGADAQRRIESSTVTIVGLGGLGSLFATQLAMIGVGRIRMLDHDYLKTENLDRTFGVDPQDIGASKVQCVAKHLRRIRPDMAIIANAQSANTYESFDFLRERSDLLLTCVDDEAARLTIATMANRTMTVHMDVASDVQRNENAELEITADIRMIIPGHGCLACVGGIDNIKLQKALIAPRPNDCLPPRLPDPWQVQRTGSLNSINLTAVGSALQIFLDLVSNKIDTSIWQRIDWTTDNGLVGNMASVIGSPTCEICSI